MTDVCKVMRPGGEEWVEGEDEIMRPVGLVEIYRGMYKDQSFRPHPRTPDVGGQTITVGNPDVHLPAPTRIPHLVAAGLVEADLDEQPFKTGDVVVNLATGREVRVMESHVKTHQTAQKLPVEDSGLKSDRVGGDLDG